VHWFGAGHYLFSFLLLSSSKVFQSATLSIKTEFMLMNTDGSGLQQLTHFRTPGYPESSPELPQLVYGVMTAQRSMRRAWCSRIMITGS
jgi:hypothetical protein